MTKQKIDQYANLTPIFKLQPQSNTRVKCRHVGYQEDLNKLSDDIIGDDINIASVGKYGIVGKYCECNVIGNYLVQNTTLPVFYASILYSKTFVTGCMFNITLFFTISDEAKKKLDNPKKYVGAFINGTYTLEISVPQTVNFLEKINQFVKDDIFLKYVGEFGKTEMIEEQIKVMEKVSEELNNKMKLYAEFLNAVIIDKIPTRNIVHKKISEICKNPLFRELLQYGLSLREKERIEERCPDISYEPPTNVISLKEIGENEGKLDEIFESRKKLV
jgi:hypothetical protein